MKKIFTLLAFLLMLGNLSVVTYAKESSPYTIGTTVTKEDSEKTTDYYSFTLNKRTTLKVQMSVLNDPSLTNYI